jgi:hypothetical protein
MKVFKRHIICVITTLLLSTNICFAQYYDEKPQDKPPPNMRCDNLQIIEKTKELVNKYQKDGYKIYQGGFYTLEHRTAFPIMVHLKARTIYHFIVVGQPELTFLQVALGHEAFGGDEVRDRIWQRRDHTYFTDFTYDPPFEGNYLFAVTSDVKKKKSFCTAIYVMIKTNALIEE